MSSSLALSLSLSSAMESGERKEGNSAVGSLREVDMCARGL